jgi:hypothetical protein
VDTADSGTLGSGAFQSAFVSPLGGSSKTGVAPNFWEHVWHERVRIVLGGFRGHPYLFSTLRTPGIARARRRVIEKWTARPHMDVAKKADFVDTRPLMPILHDGCDVSKTRRPAVYGPEIR